eukprot:3976054-Prymnesium_polylepis.1
MHVVGQFAPGLGAVVQARARRPGGREQQHRMRLVRLEEARRGLDALLRGAAPDERPLSVSARPLVARSSVHAGGRRCPRRCSSSRRAAEPAPGAAGALQHAAWPGAARERLVER